MPSLKSTQLYNIAVWHLEQIAKANNNRDRNRHADLAYLLFILAYSAR